MSTRLRNRAVLLLGLLVLAGCGERLVIVGESLGLLRVVAGIGDSIGTRVDTAATRTRLTEPGAVVFDPVSQLLYLADRGATAASGGITTRVVRIFSITSTGRLELLLESGGCAAGVCLVEATAAALALDGTLLIADGVGHRVFRFSPADRRLTVLAGTGVSAASPDGTPAAQASLRRPAGIAVGEDGSIYVAEERGNQVRRIQPDGTLGTVAGTGAAAHAGDGGSALAAALHAPTGLAVHGGALYVAEAGAHTVRVIDLAAGGIATVAGNQALGFTGDGGPALQAALATPHAIAVTADGTRLFIADRDNRRVRVVNLQTGIIATYAGDGTTRFTGPRQPAGATALRAPRGLWAAPGRLYIADPPMHVAWVAVLEL
jgi:DNA-binding beta-propeller fold protein YncE